MFRFIRHSRKLKSSAKWLTVEEHQTALIFWVKEIQRMEFHVDMQALNSDEVIDPKSR